MPEHAQRISRSIRNIEQPQSIRRPRAAHVLRLLSSRDADAARNFMTDLASRLANRAQLTTDGHKAYLTAVDKAFGEDIDYAMLIKIYGENTEGQKRYSPAVCLGCKERRHYGQP